MIKKSISKIISIVLVIVIFIIFFALAHRQSQKITLNEEIKVDTIDESNWNEYYDDQFGISFQYPSSWKAEESTYQDYRGIDIIKPGVGLITITKESNPKRLTPEEWFEEKRDDYNSQLITVISDKKIGNSRAFIVGQPATCLTAGMIVVFLDQEDSILEINQTELGKRQITAAFELKRLLETLKLDSTNKNVTDGEATNQISIEQVQFPVVTPSTVIDCPENS